MNAFFLKKQFSYALPTITMLIMVYVVMGTHQNPFYFFPSFYDHFWGKPFQVLDVLTQYGNFVFYIVYLTILALAVKYSHQDGKTFIKHYLLVQFLFTLVMVQGLKYAVGEPRPFTEDNTNQPFTTNSRYHSFPSGHTAEAIAAAGPLAYYSSAYVLSFLWGLIPAGIGFSRIYFAKHYPIDVLAGLAIGSMATYLVVYMNHKKTVQL